MDYGMNFNGDMPLPRILKGARAAEGAGFGYLWVGETVAFVHPFPLMTALCEHTRLKVGSGIISPRSNRCRQLRGAFQTLREIYGDRLVAGIAPGDAEGLKRIGAYGPALDTLDTILTTLSVTTLKRIGIYGPTLDGLRRCAEELRGVVPVFVGAQGPELLALASGADGVLLNYAHPDYVRWALGHLKKKLYAAVYAPSLLLPDAKNLTRLRVAAAIVASGSPRAFQEEFGLAERIADVKAALTKGRYDLLRGYESFLLDRFTVSGGLDEIEARIEDLRVLGVDQVIFATPMSRNLRSIEGLGRQIGGR